MVVEARKLHAVSYEEMLEMAASGARVLQLRAVEYARGSEVMLHVRSSFSDETGTWVREEDERMEQAIISGVVHDTSEAKITVEDVPDRPGIAAAIFRAVADEGIGVDTIVQNVSRDGRTDVSFTVPKDDLAHARQVMDGVASEVGAARYSADDGIAKVSLVGAGMKSHPGVQAEMFSALADAGINIEMISTSSIRITCVIRGADVEAAVRALHARFSLSDEAVVREH
jgi:aspartate kinase